MQVDATEAEQVSGLVASYSGHYKIQRLIAIGDAATTTQLRCTAYQLALQQLKTQTVLFLLAYPSL